MSARCESDEVRAVADGSRQSVLGIPVAEDFRAAVQSLCREQPLMDRSLPDGAGSSLQRSRYPDFESSSCGDCEGRVNDAACPSQMRSSDCGLLLHDLSNLVTGILLNIQLLGSKLPRYSHLKRPVREAERNAQRTAEVLKCLMRYVSGPMAATGELANSRRHESSEPTTGSRREPNRHSSATSQTVPSGDCESPESDLTRACDACTSGVVPKRDDGKEGLAANARQRKERCRKGQTT